MHTSTLVIGATGMLAEATVYLAEKSEQLTFTARSPQSISRLTKALDGAAARCRGLTLDWNDETKFIAQLAAYLDEHGYPSLTVAWLHNDCLGPKIATLLAKHSKHSTFYQVRGSAAAKPGSGSLTTGNQFSPSDGLEYNEIILGFEIDGNTSRWLSNSEISAGVISAIDSCDSVSVVGVVDPWERRP